MPPAILAYSVAHIQPIFDIANHHRNTQVKFEFGTGMMIYAS